MSDAARQAILEPLIREEDLHQGIKELVDRIATDFEGDELHVIGLLRGSFMFTADLVRLLYRHSIPLVVDFMTVSSYGGGIESSGTVNMIRDIDINLSGQQVLLVDDILDTGRTLDFASRRLAESYPASLKTCVFLDKPSRRVVPFEADYVGFTVPDLFVVGYGLDYDGRYRELPHLSVVTSEDG
ncbi:MAG: hypoxanthine phosphoribosyltransferase [Lentisphaerae bacterium]|nr:hypoxanthine phosphoribosyltransferase [Lentisphaerota bacterium]